jgi:hypothetical protein
MSDYPKRDHDLQLNSIVQPLSNMLSKEENWCTLDRRAFKNVVSKNIKQGVNRQWIYNYRFQKQQPDTLSLEIYAHKAQLN